MSLNIYYMGAVDLSLLTSYHMGLYVLIVIGLMIALVTVLKFVRAPNSDEHFSYLLREDSRPQTTRMHRISSDLCRFWRSRIKAKDINYTVFCHKNVPKSLLVEPLPVYEIVNSLIGRAFYDTEAGQIHVHITYAAKTQLSGVLNIIVANTGRGDISPIYVGQNEPYEIFDLETLEENVKRTNGYYAYKTSPGRGTEFSVSIPSEIYVPHQHQSKDIKPSQIEGVNLASSKTGPLAPKRTLQDMGQADTAAMKPILDSELIDDNRLFLPKATSKAKVALPLNAQDILDLTQVVDETLNADSSELFAPSSQTKIKLPELLGPEITGQDIVSQDIASQDIENIDALKNLNVLIFEEQKSNRAAIRALLEPLAHNSIYAENEADALKAIKTNPFDYILIGMDGAEMANIDLTQFIRNIKHGYTPVPIIALTANAASQAADNALNAGINMVLTKPTTMTTLYEAIQAITKAASKADDLSDFVEKSATA